MKNKHFWTTFWGIAVVVITSFAIWGQTTYTRLKHGDDIPKDTLPKIAVAYVEDFREGLPDPNMFTHLIYSFADFNDECDGVIIKNPQKLKDMAGLRKQNPDLKIMISIGGYKKEGFSEMTADKKKRKSFVRQVTKIIDSLELDGIDLDWEFPTTDKGGHTASPDDDKNYVLLVKDLRKSLGKSKWISYYSLSYGSFIDHKRMVPYVDYVNVSGYNLAIPREGEKLYHQSPLYSSKKLGGWCVKKSIEKHMELGVPKEKILLGIPFFGRGKSPFPSYVDCKLFGRYAGDLKPKWNDDAQAPYYTDENDNLILGFDDERSIAAKFDFIRANGIPGVFVWNYDSDYEDHRLGKAIQRLR